MSRRPHTLNAQPWCEQREQLKEKKDHTLNAKPWSWFADDDARAHTLYVCLTLSHTLSLSEQREQLKEKKEKGAAKDRAKASSVPVNSLDLNPKS